MSYLTPTFRFVEPENLKIGFLMQDGEKIIGYIERELIGKTDRSNDKLKEEKLTKNFTKQVALCKGPDNKYWVLHASGEIKLEYIK